MFYTYIQGVSDDNIVIKWPRWRHRLLLATFLYFYAKFNLWPCATSFRRFPDRHVLRLVSDSDWHSMYPAFRGFEQIVLSPPTRCLAAFFENTSFRSLRILIATLNIFSLTTFCSAFWYHAADKPYDSASWSRLFFSSAFCSCRLYTLIFYW